MPSRSPRSDRPDTQTVLGHVGVIVAVSVVMGILVAGLLIPAVGVLGYGARSAASSIQELPNQLKAEPLAQRSRVLGANGAVVATFYDENRVSVPLSSVSSIMRKSLVAIEDYRFYQHGAIDLKGTLRAFLTNQTGSGATQGGSSITQQMAKMTALAQARTKAEQKAATEDTYARKFTELRHAIAFEQNYSKDWILDRYLNLAYFGSGAYGIQSAARHYFSVDAKDLTLQQSALLAGLVKNPVGFDPVRFADRAKARRDVVLNRMAQLNIISQSTADSLIAKGLGLKISATRNGCLGSKAAFFCDYLRRYLLADPSLGKTVEDRRQLLNNGGLTIKSTVRLPFQRAADTAAANHVDPTDNAIGALAMVEPGTGNVAAIAQSRPMGRNKKKGQTFLNYVVDKKYGDANGFQGGSTFKAFVLAAAIDSGLPVSTTFASPATLAIPNNDFPDCNGPYSGFGTWEVHNSTDSGTFNMYAGTQLSVNTYFAQLEKQVGLCAPFDLARKMGVNLPYPEGNRFHRAQRVPTFTLGVSDVSPLEMAGAYATFGARGIYCAPRPVLSIDNSAGTLFKKYPKQCKRVMKEGTADQVNDILRGVMEGGFGNALQLSGHQSAGKTGTTNDNYTVWFDGYTPAMATSAVIAGANKVGTPISLNGQLLGGRYVVSAHGSTTAGPMWADAMRAISNLLPVEYFSSPPQSKPLPPPPPKPVAKPKPAAKPTTTAPAPKPKKPGGGGHKGH